MSHIIIFRESVGEWICPIKGCSEIYSSDDVNHAILTEMISLIKVGTRSTGKGESDILVRPACLLHGYPMMFNDEIF